MIFCGKIFFKYYLIDLWLNSMAKLCTLFENIFVSSKSFVLQIHLQPEW